jgi:CheY-like chemotaxis protein
MSDTPPPQQAPLATSTPEPLEPRLLVVNHTELGGLLHTLFSLNGLHTLLAASASAAQESIARQPISLAMVDMDIPDGGGLQLMARLREHLGIPVILVGSTAQDRLPVDLQHRLRDAAGYFQKPVHTRQLLNKVGSLLGLNLVDRLTPGPGVQHLPGADNDAEVIAAQQPAAAPADDDIGAEIDLSDLLTEPPALDPLPPLGMSPAGASGDEAAVAHRPGTDTVPNEAMVMVPQREAATPPTPLHAGVTQPDVTPPSQTPKPRTLFEDIATTPSQVPEALLRAIARDPPTPGGSTSTPELPHPAAARHPHEPPVGAETQMLDTWDGKRSAAGAPTADPRELPGTFPSSQTTLIKCLGAFFAHKQSGAIVLRAPNAVRTIGLHDGSVTTVTTNVPAEQVPDVLVAMGLADENAIRTAHQDTHGKTGEILTHLMRVGKVSPTQARAVLSEQRARILRACFGCPTSLEIRREPLGPAAAPPLYVGQVILRGVMASGTLKALRDAVPDAALLEPCLDGLYSQDRLDLSQEESRILNSCDGTKTVGDLLLLSDLNEPHVRGLLFALLAVTLIRPVTGRPHRREVTFF